MKAATNARICDAKNRETGVNCDRLAIGSCHFCPDDSCAEHGTQLQLIMRPKPGGEIAIPVGGLVCIVCIRQLEALGRDRGNTFDSPIWKTGFNEASGAMLDQIKALLGHQALTKGRVY